MAETGLKHRPSDQKSSTLTTETIAPPLTVIIVHHGTAKFTVVCRAGFLKYDLLVIINFALNWPCDSLMIRRH